VKTPLDPDIENIMKTAGQTIRKSLFRGDTPPTPPDDVEAAE
jgi:hypothetical protein